MIYLMISIILESLTNNLFRMIQKRKGHFIAVLTIAYLSSSLILFVHSFLNFSVPEEIPWQIIIFGSANGMLLFCGVVIQLNCYRVAGVGISSAIVGACQIIPVTAAFLLWQAPMHLPQWLAIFIIIPTMILLPPAGRTVRKINWRASMLLVSTFFIIGIVLTGHAAVPQLALRAGLDSGRSQSIYLLSLLFCAACSGLFYIINRRKPISRFDRITGLGIGIIISIIFPVILRGLEALSAAVFYPSLFCAALVINIIVGYFLWKERLIPRQYAGVLLAIAVVILANVS